MDRQQDAHAMDVSPPGRDGWHTGRVFSFDLQIPPSANTYYRTSHNIVHLSKRARMYRLAVLDATKAGDPHWPLTCRLAVDVVVCFPTRRKADIDNRLKPLLDTLQHAAVIADDSQVDSLRVTRGPVRPGGRCFVTLTELIPTLQQSELHL